MQPNSLRRVHGAEFKAQLLEECRRPGGSVAAVALAHGLDVNLVRKWLVGRGLKRAGLAAPRQVAATVPAMQFLPVELAEVRVIEPPAVGDAASQRSAATEPPIHIELRRGSAQLTVRWPSSQAAACAAWLSELAVMALAGVSGWCSHAGVSVGRRASVHASVGARPGPSRGLA